MHFTRKVCAHLWQYLAQYSLEWEIFRTKVVEKIKTHIFCLMTFPINLAVFLYNVDYGPVRGATDDNIIRCTRISCRKTKATDTHSENVILQKMVMWNSVNVTLYVYCLSCYVLLTFYQLACLHQHICVNISIVALNSYLLQEASNWRNPATKTQHFILLQNNLPYPIFYFLFLF
jgi:hypothetical protein